MRRVVLIAIAAAATVACNRGSTPNVTAPTLPVPTAPQTVYTGTITDSLSGTGTLTVSLGTSGSNVGGTWTATFPGQKSSTRFVTGTLTGNTYTATVQCTSLDGTTFCIPDCRQTLTATMTSASLAGTYTEVPNDTCVARIGSVSASRQ